MPLDQGAAATRGCGCTPRQPEVWTLGPMAHTKPASSRATATTALCFITRRASSRLNLAFSRSCALHAMSVTACGSPSVPCGDDRTHAQAVRVVPGHFHPQASRGAMPSCWLSG